MNDIIILGYWPKTLTVFLAEAGRFCFLRLTLIEIQQIFLASILVFEPSTDPCGTPSEFGSSFLFSMENSCLPSNFQKRFNQLK